MVWTILTFDAQIIPVLSRAIDLELLCSPGLDLLTRLRKHTIAHK